MTIAEKYANTLYHHQPDIIVARWWVPGYPIMVGGSLIDRTDFDHLASAFGITHVVNVETEHDDEGKCPERRLLQIRVPDDGSPIPVEFVAQLADFCELNRDPSATFYIHCQMGGSRSPAFAYALLRSKYELTREEALAALNRGFTAKKVATGHNEASAEAVYGWHPVHQAYLASIDSALLQIQGRSGAAGSPELSESDQKPAPVSGEHQPDAAPLASCETPVGAEAAKPEERRAAGIRDPDLPLLLNIASGPNLFPRPWLNLDLVDQSEYLGHLRAAPDYTGWPPEQKKVADNAIADRIDFRVHDLRKGFAEFADGSIAAIYLGQMIEHLNPIYEVPAFLSECFRMLKPGGVLRLTTPDLELLLDAYATDDMMRFASEQPAWYASAPDSAQLVYLMFGACGPNCTRENYEGHFLVFSREHMAACLRGAGFTGELEFYADPHQSMEPELMAEVVDMGLSHSMICEVRKP